MHFQEDETVTFYKGPLPQPICTLHRGPPGELYNFYSSPNKVSTIDLIEIDGIYTLHNLTILLLDLEMFEICMVLALGGPPPGAPMGATHTIWTTLNPLPLRMISAKFD